MSSSSFFIYYTTFKGISHFVLYYLDANTILFNGKRVGGARVKWHNGRNVKWISPIFVIPQFPNKGIASAVIERLFEVYSSDTIEWRLDTIKQEEKNCYLYEKCGFVRVGDEIVINEKMTLVEYTKIC